MHLILGLEAPLAQCRQSSAIGSPQRWQVLQRLHLARTEVEKLGLVGLSVGVRNTVSAHIERILLIQLWLVVVEVVELVPGIIDSPKPEFLAKSYPRNESLPFRMDIFLLQLLACNVLNSRWIVTTA